MPRTTRITDGKLPNQCRKWEDRGSHFGCSWWSRLIVFINERWTIQLSIHIKFEIEISKFWPNFGLARREVRNLPKSTSFLWVYDFWLKRVVVYYITMNISCTVMTDNKLGNISSLHESSHPKIPENGQFLRLFLAWKCMK